MQTKAADDRQPDLDALDALLVRPDVDAATRKRIEREIKAIRAGVAGERDAAYEIEFHYGKSQNRVTVHDLRLEVDGRVAQIDHLMISRLMIVWVCESKHFSEGVSVNDHGEWNGWFGGRPYGIPSPVEQNRRHIAVLKAVFDQGLIELPRRLGITLKPELRSLVLVSNGARISRPKSKAAAAAAGLDQVIKADQLRARIEDEIDHMSMRYAGKIVSAATIESIGRQLAALHRQSSVNWEARFGLTPFEPTPSPLNGTPKPPPGKSGRGRDSGRTCARCAAPLSAGDGLDLRSLRHECRLSGGGRHVLAGRDYLAVGRSVSQGRHRTCAATLRHRTVILRPQQLRQSAARHRNVPSKTQACARWHGLYSQGHSRRSSGLRRHD